MKPVDLTNNSKTIFLRRFSKLTCFSTLFLIFAGGMVTSTGSGLSVPDWPLSYGMLFPPMVGGVFYEHGHRMVAATVGFLTLCLAVSLTYWERRKWVKVLGFCALGAVILQGILGGITVLFFLPKPISIGHAVLAQTFFILTIIIAYTESTERSQRSHLGAKKIPTNVLKGVLFLVILVYCQLMIGAVMRHTHSGLAIPDFPTMGGYWWPPFHEMILDKINQVRLDLNWQYNLQLEPVTMTQVVIHFLHRLFALLITLAVVTLDILGTKSPLDPKLKRTLFLINLVLFIQVALGIITVLSLKSPVITSLHVVTGGGGWLGLLSFLFLFL